MPLFPVKPAPQNLQEEYGLSRFETNIERMLQSHVTNSLDPTTFPYTKPPLDLGEAEMAASATSLRTAKPTWAKTKNTSSEPRQRIIVYMAGGATYSESRACYEVGRKTNKEIFMVTSHMMTPALFVRQIGDLSVDRRRLGIPAEMPKPQAPAHLFEKEEQPKAVVAQQVPAKAPVKAVAKPAPAPPTQAIGAMKLNGGGGPPPPSVPQTSSSSSPSKLTKDPEKKKKHHFFSSKNK